MSKRPIAKSMAKAVIKPAPDDDGIGVDDNILNTEEVRNVGIEDIDAVSDEEADAEAEPDAGPNAEADPKEGSKSEQELSHEFREKVITYIKCDDLIRKSLDEIKELKAKKKPCEEFILQFLERKDAPFVLIKNGKLIKNKSETKGSLKIDVIKDSILEGIKDEKLSDNEVKTNDIATKIMEIMEAKRAKTVRVNLKRTFQRKQKAGKGEDAGSDAGAGAGASGSGRKRIKKNA